jgi:hypothetical protein
MELTYEILGIRPLLIDYWMSGNSTTKHGISLIHLDR